MQPCPDTITDILNRTGTPTLCTTLRTVDAYPPSPEQNQLRQWLIETIEARHRGAYAVALAAYYADEDCDYLGILITAALAEDAVVHAVAA